MSSFFLFLIFFSAKSWAGLIVVQGQSQSMKAKGAIQIEKNPYIEISEGSQGLLIKGKKVGVARIRIKGRVEEVQVLSLQQDQTRQALQNIMHKTLGLKLEVSQAQIVIRGRLTRLKDWLTLSDACRNLLCKYSFQAEMSSDMRDKANKRINENLIERSLPPQNFSFSKEVSALVYYQLTDFSRMENTLSNYGIRVLRSRSSLPVQPLIKIVITLAEVRRDEFLKYGVSWPENYSAQVLPSFSSGSSSLTAQFLETNGLGKILASPNLLCRSGKAAEFIAGGEFPIKMMSTRMQSVVWKKYGILLRVKPEADFSGRMSISIETEVSSIDSSKTVDGIPGLYTNRVQSHFDLLKPQTIALSGLIKSEESKSSQGLPGLSRIPILGALFSSKDFRNNRTELVILVRPEIIYPHEEMGQ